LSFALLPLISPFPFLSSSFCLLPSAFSPQTPLSIGSLGQSALQATRERVAWEALGNHSGILSDDILINPFSPIGTSGHVLLERLVRMRWWRRHGDRALPDLLLQVVIAFVSCESSP
jgi:hypothetical protein